jgi:hypothetical protein
VPTTSPTSNGALKPHFANAVTNKNQAGVAQMFHKVHSPHNFQANHFVKKTQHMQGEREQGHFTNGAEHQAHVATSYGHYMNQARGHYTNVGGLQPTPAPFLNGQTGGEENPAEALHVPLALVQQGLKVKSKPPERGTLPSFYAQCNEMFPSTGCGNHRARNGDKCKILLTAYLYDTVKQKPYHAFPALR